MTFLEQCIQDSMPIWQDCLESEFVQGVAHGTLPEECFKGYIVDDSLYLREYSKVFAWGILHSHDMEEIRNYYSLLSFVNESEDATRRYYLKRYHLTDTWTEDNPDATYPRIKFASKNDNNRKDSDFWIRNCNYLRLRSLTIGYALPAKLLQKKKINSVSIALQGSNLFTISSLENGIDPESLRGYPIQRSYGVTLNFGF